MTHPTLAAWHALIRSRDPRGLPGLLAADAVFHSPIVHTPQHGRELTARYLAAAFHVLAGEGFRYVRELSDADGAVLEFEVQIDGVHVNGVDLIRWDGDGRITDFKVMLRPLKAVNLVHERMARMLAGAASSQPPGT